MKARTRWAALILILITGFAVVPAAETPPPSLFVVHFTTGPTWDKSLPPADQKGFEDHSANMSRLRKEGAIAFGARYEEVGMIVLKAASLDAARSIIDADPGVQSRLFVYHIAPLRIFYPWQN